MIRSRIGLRRFSVESSSVWEVTALLGLLLVQVVQHVVEDEVVAVLVLSLKTK